MKSRLLLLLTVVYSFTVFSQNNYLTPETNAFSLTNNGDSRSSVNFGDLDNDGDLDIISGSSGMGFFYYENIGNSIIPVYDSPVNNPFNLIAPSSGALFTPVFVDIDNDGDLDIVSGNNFGRFYFYENIGTASSPNYTDQIQGAFGLVESSFILLSPFFVDIDGDNDFDMFAGVFSESNGNFYFFENTGTDTAPSYAIPVQDPFNLTWSSGTASSGFSAPSFADFDDDGDFDLLAGSSSGNFYYYENIGSNTVPSFDNSLENPFNLEQSYSVTIPHAIDIDGDIDLDIMVGSNSGDFGFYKNEIPLPMTLIPDPNFEQALIDQGIDTGGILDGEVLTVDLEIVNMLDLTALEISDLTGIQDFIALETLTLEGNPALSTIDIGALSNLTSLNVKDTGLLSLDLTGNTNLIFLDISFLSLSSIDLSSLPNLLTLLADNTSLANLDISNNSLLQNFNASSAGLVNLDLSNNEALTEINVSFNSLIDLDLTSNINLETVNVSFNNLETLDIVQNVNLTSLFANNNNLELAFLANGNNTNITSENFDILNNPNLSCINVDSVTFSEANWPNKDATATYSEDCLGIWVVYTTDPVFETAIEESGADTDGDGEITYEEAQEFTGDLELNNQGITDVTGLEAFTNANILDLSDNLIEDINTFLLSDSFIVELEFPSGRIQRSVLRPKIRIKSLNVARNNLTEVDISRTEGMETLDVSGNPLISLTLAPGTTLLRDDDSSVIRSADNLTSLDATDTGGGLNCIQVDDVADANSKVTSGAWLIDAGSTFSTNCSASLSTDEFLLENYVKIHPNPANSIVSIILTNSINLESAEVYDLLGKRVIKTSDSSINVDILPVGLYVLNVYTDKGLVSKKVVIN